MQTGRRHLALQQQRQLTGLGQSAVQQGDGMGPMRLMARPVTGLQAQGRGQEQRVRPVAGSMDHAFAAVCRFAKVLGVPVIQRHTIGEQQILVVLTGMKLPPERL